MPVLPFGINRIKDSQAKREAIQARQTLYHAGVKAYRAEAGEGRWRRQAEEREEGAGRER